MRMEVALELAAMPLVGSAPVAGSLYPTFAISRDMAESARRVSARASVLVFSRLLMRKDDASSVLASVSTTSVMVMAMSSSRSENPEDLRAVHFACFIIFAPAPRAVRYFA
jgi:hypothetical protein